MYLYIWRCKRCVEIHYFFYIMNPLFSVISQFRFLPVVWRHNHNEWYLWYMLPWEQLPGLLLSFSEITQMNLKSTEQWGQHYWLLHLCSASMAPKVCHGSSLWRQFQDQWKGKKLRNSRMSNSKEKETFGCLLMCFTAVEYMYTNGGSDNSHKVKKKKKVYSLYIIYASVTYCRSIHTSTSAQSQHIEM